MIVEALELMRRLDPEPRHARHVARLTESFWEQSLPMHLMSEREGLLLLAAALLHDTGWSEAPDGRRHHKLSARLIRAHKWESLKPAEVELVAQIARYHRRACPSSRHHPYQKLGKMKQRMISQAAALLRMADALDRSHRRIISGVELHCGPKRCQLHAAARGPATAELLAFNSKCDLFERTYRRVAELVVSPPEAMP